MGRALLPGVAARQSAGVQLHVFHLAATTSRLHPTTSIHWKTDTAGLSRSLQGTAGEEQILRELDAALASLSLCRAQPSQPDHPSHVLVCLHVLAFERRRRSLANQHHPKDDHRPVADPADRHSVYWGGGIASNVRLEATLVAFACPHS